MMQNRTDRPIESKNEQKKKCADNDGLPQHHLEGNSSRKVSPEGSIGVDYHQMDAGLGSLQDSSNQDNSLDGMAPSINVESQIVEANHDGRPKQINEHDQFEDSAEFKKRYSQTGIAAPKEELNIQQQALRKQQFSPKRLNTANQNLERQITQNEQQHLAQAQESLFKQQQYHQQENQQTSQQQQQMINNNIQN